MTPRQQQLLHAIVEYFVQTANPVGSLNLSKRFGYSPATIRAEMVNLEELGYITHPHTSAGRIPTDKGYRHYVDWLQQKAAKVEKKREEDRREKALQQKMNAAGGADNAVKTVVESLADITNSLGWATLPDGIYMKGMPNLFGQPELNIQSKAYEVARLLEHLEDWIGEIAPHQNRVSVFIGEENPIGKSSGCSLIIARFASPYNNESYVGLVGPTRQDYPKVIGLLDYASKQLEEALHV